MKFFHCTIENRLLSNVVSVMLTECLSGYVCVGFLIINQLPCPISSHQHGLHLHPGLGVNVVEESWIFSADGVSGNVQPGPGAAGWAEVFSCGLYLQEKQWVSCLRAAPTVTPLHVERAAVSRDFSLQLPLSHSLLDRLCDVVKCFAVQATVFKNTFQ